MNIVNNYDILLCVYLLRSTGGMLINKHCSKYQDSFLAPSVLEFTQSKQWFAHPACGSLSSETVAQEPQNCVLKTLISGGGWKNRSGGSKKKIGQQ